MLSIVHCFFGSDRVRFEYVHGQLKVILLPRWFGSPSHLRLPLQTSPLSHNGPFETPQISAEIGDTSLSCSYVTVSPHDPEEPPRVRNLMCLINVTAGRKFRESYAVYRDSSRNSGLRIERTDGGTSVVVRSSDNMGTDADGSDVPAGA